MKTTNYEDFKKPTFYKDIEVVYDNKVSYVEYDYTYTNHLEYNKDIPKEDSVSK